MTAITALVAGSVFGQVGSGATMGTLTGLVTQDGNPLPGVSVTISSPNLQGTRSSVTNEAGGFNFGALPPGNYTVRFELSGMQPVTKTVKIGVAQSSRADAEMRVSAVTEAITVTAAAPAVAETSEVQTNMPGKLIDELPVARTPAAIALLAPGVVSGVNGPTISGGFSFDNLYTVNGAVIQENLRGQTHNLYIEDAVQETTIQTAGVSAEFGNFTGGVVNAITKSGGNEFSGSLRDTLLNPKWTEKSPVIHELDPTATPPNSTTRPVQPPENVDELNQTYEATLGGRIIRDRLWFFLAGRFVNLESERVFDGGGGRSFTTKEEEKRMEGKLTAAITPRHSVVGSYLDAPLERANECQVTGCYDISAVDPSTSRPATFATFNYNGIITNNFLIEANWSQKEFTFVGTGGEDPDRVTGTPLLVGKVGGYVNEPYFAGKTPEERDNMAWGAKATYYVGSRSFGAHNLIGGYQHWHEKRLSDNFQSPSDYVFRSFFFAPKIVNGQTLVSIKGGTAQTDFMIWFPILEASQGSDLNTDSLYVNDKWDLSNRWSFNLGARYDKNDSKDSRGAVVADDSKISPRLGAAFDVFGTGRLRFNATYGHYVGRLAETITNAGSAAGTPATFAAYYGGPDIIDVPSEEAMRQIWAWFDSQGGFEAVTPFSVSIPGATSQIPESLVSPNVQEMTLGVSTQMGAGFLRLDYVDRDWADFYESRRTLEIGKVTLPGGRVSDLTLVGNTNDLERTYKGITVQGGYRLLNRINIGGNYTWSELRGNVSQESVGSVVVTEGTRKNFQPEYFDFDQNDPIGFLPGDQTHKLRAWVNLDIPTFLGNFNLSLLQNFDSGDAYSHDATIDIRSSANFYGTGQPGGVTNPGYQTPPSTVTYFFSDRGEFRFDDTTSTNLALNYNTNPSWMGGLSIFAQAEVLNAFNEDSGTWNTEILTHRTDTTLKRFNPMAGDVPQEGVHWRKGVRYGKPTGRTIPIISVTGLSSGGSFQIPRTYRFSLGLRF